MKELYEKVIKAYKSGDANALAAAARNWIDAKGENPFEEGSPARSYYFAAIRANEAWRSKNINYRVSKKRMISNVEEIAKLNLPNPYEKKIVIPDEPIHIFGVPEELEQPEEKNFFFFREVGEPDDSEGIDQGT